MAGRVIKLRLESEHFSCEDVHIRKLHGREAISQLFRFEVEIMQAHLSMLGAGLTAADLSGAEATIVFERDGEELRRLHGMIAEVEDALETEPDYNVFQLVFVPRAHRLSLVQTQQIFMGSTIEQLIRDKFTLVGLGGDAVDVTLGGRSGMPKIYDPMEFVVQYRETDLAFLSRLTEHLGISFYFRETNGLDQIVFTDPGSGFDTLSPENIPYDPDPGQHHVFSLTARTRVIPKSYLVQDYNYRTPQLEVMSSTATAPGGLAGGVVEYGAHFKLPTQGDELAAIRAEEQQCAHQVFHGKSEVCQLRPGAIFQLQQHPRLGGKTPMLITEVEHRAHQVVGLGSGTGERSYENSFSSVIARDGEGMPYRPPRRTPKPRIHGVVNGIVGEDGTIKQYAELDEQGRYLIHVLFDTSPEGARPNPSRPIRMAQPHAGPYYGMHLPLKPGIEVLLTFIDGDPDRPILIASVPNPITRTPVDRSNAIMNRIKTASGVIIEMKDS